MPEPSQSEPSGVPDADRREACDGRVVPEFAQAYPATPEAVNAIRSTIADFATQAGASRFTIGRVKLAISEAATNVVLHAYRAVDQPPGLIHVEATFAAGELRVSVSDTGRGLRPRDDSPGLGLGLAIIEEVADHLELLQNGSGGLRVLMSFAVRASATGT